MHSSSRVQAGAGHAIRLRDPGWQQQLCSGGTGVAKFLLHLAGLDPHQQQGQQQQGHLQQPG